MERPIIFSGGMVAAIHDGRKTQTRRVKAPLPPSGTTPEPTPRCPYGQPGDRLWVRETWCSWEEVHYLEEDDEGGSELRQTYVAYAATPRRGYRPVPDRAAITYLDESSPLERNRHLLGPWKSPIHMPRWASRLTLEVTAVRVERLQRITAADVVVEGLPVPDVDYRVPSRPDVLEAEREEHARDLFQAGWDAINGKRCPWAENPWVWVVSFRRAG